LNFPYYVINSAGNGFGEGIMAQVSLVGSTNTPTEYSLSQNFPNPFNLSTYIKYALPSQSEVKISIYNILGQKVVELFNGNQPAGYHHLTWKSQEGSGTEVASGVYICILEAKSLDNGSRFVKHNKMVLMK